MGKGTAWSAAAPTMNAATLENELYSTVADKQAGLVQKHVEKKSRKVVPNVSFLFVRFPIKHVHFSGPNW